MFENTRFHKLAASALAATAAFLTFSLAKPADAQESFCPAGECARRPAEGWIRGPEGPVFASYEHVDGVAVIEGDIVVEELGPVSRSAIGDGPVATWPNGVIPYTTNGIANTATLQAAIDHLNANTALTLVPRTGENDYLEFFTGSGCWSYVGRRGGLQQASVGACPFGSTVHEILHASGIWHEQSRSDRDSHVMINYANIDPTYVSNFDVFAPGTGQNHGAYDYNSIMHYPGTAFSINGQPTIVPLVPASIGQRSALSPGDIAGVAALYGGSTPPPPAVETLLNGVPRSPLMAPTGSALRFQMDVPVGAQNLALVMSGGTGDADMHVAFGRPATTSDYDCRPYQVGNAERCDFATPQAGTWHVLLQAYQAFDSVTLVGSFGGGTPSGMTPVTAAKLKVKQDANNAAKDKVSLKSTDAAIAAPAPGVAGDPSVSGGRIRIVNPNTGEQGVIELPAAGWTRKANGTLRFSGAGCKVTVKPTGKLKLGCKGTVGGFTLNEAAQGVLGIKLELGTGSGFCAGGGLVTRDYGIGFGASPSKGNFVSVDGPRPGGCGF